MDLKRSIVLVLVLIMWGCKDKVQEPALTESNAPQELQLDKTETSYEDLEGNPVSLSDFKGKKILLNYWATWCRPCIEEMPALLRAQEILTKENYIFLLASDQSMDKIKTFVNQRKFDFKFIRYKGSLAELGINALPTTLFYNETGDQVLKVVGQTDWDSDEAIEQFKNLK